MRHSGPYTMKAMRAIKILIARWPRFFSELIRERTETWRITTALMGLVWVWASFRVFPMQKHALSVRRILAERKVREGWRPRAGAHCAPVIWGKAGKSLLLL